MREVEGVELDEVTGLPSLPSMIARLDALLAEGRRPAVYVLAVDGYDVLAARDPEGARESMREAAQRLDRLVRSSDVLGTVQPGTFILVGAGIEPAVAGSLVERIQGALAFPMDVGGESLSLRVDIGVAFSTAGSVSRDLVESAGADLRRSRPQ